VDGFSASAALTQPLIEMAPHLTAQTAGYIPFFVTTALMGVPALVLIVVVMVFQPKPAPKAPGQAAGVPAPTV